jgi:hypothetical protein
VLRAEWDAMSLKILGRLFTGPNDPQRAAVRVNHAPAVFAIIDKGGQSWDPQFRMIDLGDTGGAAVVFAEHPDLARWQAAAQGQLSIYFYVPDPDDGDPAAQRRALIEEIRANWPPGGLIAPGR